jgi:hypothetical protein
MRYGPCITGRSGAETANDGGAPKHDVQMATRWGELPFNDVPMRGGRQIPWQLGKNREFSWIPAIKGWAHTILRRKFKDVALQFPTTAA